MRKTNFFGESDEDYNSTIIIVVVILVILVILVVLYYFLTQKKEEPPPPSPKETPTKYDYTEPKSYAANVCKSDGTIYQIRVPKNSLHEPIDDYIKRILTYVTSGYTDEVHVYNPPDVNKPIFTRSLKCKKC